MKVETIVGGGVGYVACVYPPLTPQKLGSADGYAQAMGWGGGQSLKGRCPEV